MMYGLSIGECHVTFPGRCIKTIHSMTAQSTIIQRLLKKSWKLRNRYNLDNLKSTMYSGVYLWKEVGDYKIVNPFIVGIVGIRESVRTVIEEKPQFKIATKKIRKIVNIGEVSL